MTHDSIDQRRRDRRRPVVPGKGTRKTRRIPKARRLELRILRDNPEASFRLPAADQALDASIEERTLGGYCPHCSREVPPRRRDATLMVCVHCGGRYT